MVVSPLLQFTNGRLWARLAVKGWARQLAIEGIDVDDNFKISRSEFLTPEDKSGGSSLASECWHWLGENKLAIGATVGLAVGSVAAAKFLGPVLAAKAEGAMVAATSSTAERAIPAVVQPLAQNTVLDTRVLLAQLTARAEAAPVAGVAASNFDLKMVELLKARAKEQTMTIGGFRQMMGDAAAQTGRGGGFPAAYEGAPAGSYMASANEQHTYDWWYRTIHDGGAHHAGVFEDGYLRDLLGVDPRLGERRMLDETLQIMRRPATDLPTELTRHTPGLRFEMPALSVRKRTSWF